MNFLGHLTDPLPSDLDYRVRIGKGFVLLKLRMSTMVSVRKIGPQLFPDHNLDVLGDHTRLCA